MAETKRGRSRGGASELERRRRQFARRTRRGRRPGRLGVGRRRFTWRRILALVVLLGVAVGAVYLLYFSPVLAVRDVRVTGTTTLTRQQVLSAARVPTGGPLASADLDAVSVRVGNIAAVREVDVTRQWPHTVHITVVERTPLAVISIAGKLHALDVTGAVFDDYAQAPPGLPLVTVAAGATVGDGSDAQGLQQVATVVAALPSSLVAVTDHVELRGPDDVELALTDDRVVRWGSSAQSDVKAEVLATLLQRKAHVYDVSVPGAPVTSG